MPYRKMRCKAAQVKTNPIPLTATHLPKELLPAFAQTAMQEIPEVMLIKATTRGAHPQSALCINPVPNGLWCCLRLSLLFGLDSSGTRCMEEIGRASCR